MMNQFWQWWQHIPSYLSPTIFQIGPFQLRYYGLMYIVAFIIFYLLVLYRLKHEVYEYSKDVVQNYLLWAMMGVLIGGRLGYAAFYNLKFFISSPLAIISPFDCSNGCRFVGISGMSFHGGVIGIVLLSIFFCLKYRIDFWDFADLLAPAIPLGYTFGRLGNFINGELYGRSTDAPWGMYFPLDPAYQLRHPSQLYEAFFEGIFLFTILWTLRKKRYFNGFLLSLYLIGYGLVRFCIEFVREPDPQLGLIWEPMTMGQILCAAMILGGTLIMFLRKRLTSGDN